MSTPPVFRRGRLATRPSANAALGRTQPRWRKDTGPDNELQVRAGHDREKAILLLILEARGMATPSDRATGRRVRSSNKLLSLTDCIRAGANSSTGRWRPVQHSGAPRNRPRRGSSSS
eukprot:9456333-Alexandrium_andersonii.AAC.1